jgi:hypothetical protein
VSGVAPDRIQRIIERDWIHLIREKGILDSPNYLREKGKPVVALWGMSLPKFSMIRLIDLLQDSASRIPDIRPVSSEQ